MILIPIQLTSGSKRGPLVLILILEKENLDRMKEGDPLDFQPKVLDKRFNTNRPIRDLDIVIAYEEDLKPIMEFQGKDDIDGLLKYLERGRVHKPGDALPPTPLRKT
jgi:hypothetical protein